MTSSRMLSAEGVDKLPDRDQLFGLEGRCPAPDVHGVIGQLS
jgi:hypothetical protein